MCIRDRVRSLGRDLPRHGGSPIVPHEMHRPETSFLDELNNVPSKFRGAIRATGPGSSPRRVATLVGCDGAVPTRVQERGNRVPGARVLRETMPVSYTHLTLPTNREV